MKGFIVLLKPKDASGIIRNQEYMEKTKGVLIQGGIAELLPDGSLRCSWIFAQNMPDYLKRTILRQFTKALDDAILKKDNVEYQVELL